MHLFTSEAWLLRELARLAWALRRAHDQDVAQRLPPAQLARVNEALVDLLVCGPAAAAAASRRGSPEGTPGNTHRRPTTRDDTPARSGD
jgi:hypothetical protein